MCGVIAVVLFLPHLKITINQFSAGDHALIIVGAGQAGVLQAAKNISTVTVLSVDQLNVYDIVRAQVIVIPERELGRVKEVWS